MPKHVMWFIPIIIWLIPISFTSAADIEPVQPSDEGIAELKQELAGKGWIAYSARGDNGSWDLFLSRPDGTALHNITNTPNSHEAGVMFSPDSKNILYRQLPKDGKIDHDRWGFQGELVIADANGANPRVIGEDKEYPWATWSPDGENILCLTLKGIHVYDLKTKELIRTYKRQGIYQQLFWSPDGKWFVGTGNVGQKGWRVVRINAETGELNPVTKTQSCTPDWFPDSKRVIYSTRPEGQTTNDGYGWTYLAMADGDGQNVQMIYGEEGRHIYGGALSPDCEYVLFTRLPNDGGGAEKTGAPIYIMRMADAPTIYGKSKEIRAMTSNPKTGPVFHLAQGWEPCWTYAEIGGLK